jgi:alkanesulfonate monooxygenase SsuD/methylene tetrahydromethanopterin reductase-like flavin-dependent oxidoreductase (luciferase family)
MKAEGPGRSMKIGVTLPQFRDEGESAVAGAARAEELGLDGVFVFDHLWPIGSPDRPIIAALPLLGALAVETTRIQLGTLVARVGLVPDDVLVQQLSGVARLSGGRFIAGLGTGDRLSAAENLAYGVDYPAAAERRASLERCGARLRGEGIPVWVGAGPRPHFETREVAVRVGATLNVWQETGEPMLSPDPALEVTWAGPLRGGTDRMVESIRGLGAAGASWVVCAWPDSLDDVAAVRDRLNP